MQHDARAALRRIVERSRARSRRTPLPSRRPAPGLFAAGEAADHVDPVGHHEGRVEADAELADELGVVARLAGARARSMKARVPERAIVPSASAISSRLMPMPLSSTVSSLVVRIGRDRDARLGIVAEQFGAADRLEAQPFAGVRGIGDQLAQEDVLVGIDRMHHHVQQPRDIGLECPGFRRFRVRRHPDFPTLFIRPPRRARSGLSFQPFFAVPATRQVPARPTIWWRDAKATRGRHAGAMTMSALVQGRCPAGQ